MNRTSRTTTLVLGLAFALGVPGAAQAEDFCVGTSCYETSQPQATLQAAIDAAAKTPEPDTIWISSGGLDNVNATAGPSNEVQILGQGVEQPRVSGAPGVNAPVISIANKQSRIGNLHVEMGAGSGSGLQLLAGRASRVSVISGKQPVTGGVGVKLGIGASLTESTVTMLDSPSAPMTAVNAMAAGTEETSLSKSDLFGQTGLASTGSGVVRAENLDIRDTAVGAVQSGGGTLSLANSVVRADQGTAPIALAASAQGAGTTTLAARHVTALGTGKSPNGIGVSSAASGPGSHASVALRDSIVYGFGKSLSRTSSLGSAELSVGYSAYNTATVAQSGGGSIATGAGNTSADPGFAEAGTHRLAASSALIDAGDPAPPLAGDSAYDFNEVGYRVVDGNGDGVARRDIGAFEYEPEQPAGPVGGGGAQAGGQVSGGQAGGGSRKIAKDTTRPVVGRPTRSGVTIRFTLSEAGRVRLTLARKVRAKRGKLAFKAVKTVTHAGRAGANRLSLGRKLAPGSYRVVIAAVDGSGNRSAPRTVAFRVGGSR